jgi:hypothetical protein
MPRRITEILPDIPERMASGRSWCDRRRRTRLSQGGDVSRQGLPIFEVGQRRLRCLVWRRTARDKLAPTVIEMLRELFNNFHFARRRKTHRG